MSWSEMTLALPATPAPVICQERAVHPWDEEHGHNTPDGRYLSPVNAVAALAGYVGDNAQDVIIIMVCASDVATFAEKLAGLSSVLPLPSLNQITRRATTQITQAVTRMQIPSTPVGGLSPSGPLMVSSLQNAINNQQAQAASKITGFGDVSSIKTALSDFMQQRQKIQQQLAAEQAAISVSQARVFAFIHTAGAGELIKSAMMTGIPAPASSLTYAHLFTGDLSGMMAWFKAAI